MHEMRAYCPECNSRDLQKRSRRVFLIRALICLVIFSFGYLLLDSILHDKDEEAIMVGILCGMLTMAIAAIVGLILVIWAVITKKTSYKCRYCKSIFDAPNYCLAVTETAHEALMKLRSSKDTSNSI